MRCFLALYLTYKNFRKIWQLKNCEQIQCLLALYLSYNNSVRYGS